jgi:hypothetical protein
MKKIFQSVFFLLLAGMVSVNAQVRIGSDSEPHGGSILDLSNAGSLGMLLPRVSLDAADVFKLSGDATASTATGMVVYNTNATMANGYGAGIYVWDGAKWNIVGQGVFVPGDYGMPDATYNPILNGVSCIDVSAGQNEPGAAQYIAIETGSGMIDNVTWFINQSTQGLFVSNIISGTGNVSQTLTLKSRAELSALAASADQTITLIAYIEYSDGKKVQISKNVKIRNRSCCSGVIIPGGVYTGPASIQIPDNTTYDQVISDYGFVRQASQDLCVYYRDASSLQDRQTAIDDCASGANVDAVDRSDTWRLPNIAELSQMSTNANAPAPKYDALTSVEGADPRTINIESYYYWSVTENDSISSICWKYFDSGTWFFHETATVYVRCVRTMN